MVDPTHVMHPIHHSRGPRIGCPQVYGSAVAGIRGRPHHLAVDLTAARGLLTVQDGVVSRRQLLELGVTPPDIARMLRRRELARLLPGVYIDHTGRPTWQQRAWAGLLHVEPAALTHASAVRAALGPGWRAHDERAPIQIAVPAPRHVVQPAGYRIRRTRDLERRVMWNTSPPRVRLDDALLDVASEAPDDLTVVGVLADAVQARGTTAHRLLNALVERPRLAQRDWITAVLRDVADGSCSVLEHCYLTRVERPHRLPRGQRQRPGAALLRPDRVYRDVVYRQFGQYVELDGRLFHDTPAQRDRDLERDLDASIERASTVRLGYGQVVGRPCSTAMKVGLLLAARGWAGAPVPCGPGCAIRIAA